MGAYYNVGDKGTVPQEQGAQGHGDGATLTPLQVHYLHLLERLINLKTTYQIDPHREEWLLKVINKAAYSSFRSCLEQGVEAQAKGLLDREHQAN